MLALALDLTLRSSTDASLDDIVRALWLRFGQSGSGLPEDGFESLAAEIGGEAIREFLTRAVEGTDDPDLPALFESFGLTLRFRQAEGPQDRGGTPPKNDIKRLDIGATCQAHAAGLTLTVVPDGQAAQQAGLAPGDVIVALDPEPAVVPDAPQGTQALARLRTGGPGPPPASSRAWGKLVLTTATHAGPAERMAAVRRSSLSGAKPMESATLSAEKKPIP